MCWGYVLGAFRVVCCRVNRSLARRGWGFALREVAGGSPFATSAWRRSTVGHRAVAKTTHCTTLAESGNLARIGAFHAPLRR